MTAVTIARVSASDLDELMALMRGYCEFYEASPTEQALRMLANDLLEHPDTSGIQLVARTPEGTAVGFATLYWTYSTLSACPIGLMNDLYVAPAVRGAGVGRSLIEACAAACAQRGVSVLEWETAPDNTRAQALYDSTGATREEWVAYSLSVS
jgi:ribosomal protein S18 acetylase RimI-like enzyme